MSEFELRVCGNCAAFGMLSDNVIESDEDGSCRLYPPQLLAIGLDGEFASSFPNVNREDWCLSWRAKEGGDDR